MDAKSLISTNWGGRQAAPQGVEMHWTSLREQATPIMLAKGYNDWAGVPTIQTLIQSEACKEVFYGPSKFQVGEWVARATPFIGNRYGMLVTEIRHSDEYQYVIEGAGVVRVAREEYLEAYDAWVKDVGQARRMCAQRYQEGVRV